MTSSTLEKQSFIPTSSEAASVAELVGARDDYEEELLNLREAMDEAYEQLSEKDKKLLESIEDEYFQLDESEQQSASLAGILEGYGFPSDAVSLMRQFDTVQVEMEKVNHRLDGDHGEPLARYVIDEAKQLLESLDKKAFNKMKASGISLPDEDGIELPLFTSMNLQETYQRVMRIIDDLGESIENGDPSFSDAEMDLHAIAIARQIFEKWGVISENAASVEIAERTKQETAALEYLKSGLLNVRYRTNYPELTTGHEVEVALSKLPIYEWGIGLSVDQVDNLRNNIQSTDKEKELARIRIEGVEKNSFGIDESAIRDHIGRVIPPLALEGIEKIVFKMKDGTEGDDQESAGWERLAHHAHSQYKNSAEIVIWLDPLEAMMSKKDEAMVQDEFFRTLDHEFGHAFSTVLPAEFLRFWDERVMKDNIRITDYVAHRYEAGHPHRYAEDFADSFSMFINSTNKLYAKSLRRFWGMYDLFGLSVKGKQRVYEFQRATGRLPEAADVNFE